MNSFNAKTIRVVLKKGENLSAAEVSQIKDLYSNSKNPLGELKHLNDRFNFAQGDVLYFCSSREKDIDVLELQVFELL